MRNKKSGNIFNVSIGTGHLFHKNNFNMSLVFFFFFLFTFSTETFSCLSVLCYLFPDGLPATPFRFIFKTVEILTQKTANYYL